MSGKRPLLFPRVQSHQMTCQIIITLEKLQPADWLFHCQYTEAADIKLLILAVSLQ